MKVLFIKSHIHHKNLNFILKCKKINFYIVDSINQISNIDLNTFDAVISPCDTIDVSKYPNIKFIFGPQFSVFPEDRLKIIKGPKTVYNLLSNWVINIWKNLMHYHYGFYIIHLKISCITFIVIIIFGFLLVFGWCVFYLHYCLKKYSSVLKHLYFM